MNNIPKTLFRNRIVYKIKTIKNISTHKRENSHRVSQQKVFFCYKRNHETMSAARVWFITYLCVCASVWPTYERVRLASAVSVARTYVCEPAIFTYWLHATNITRHISTGAFYNSAFTFCEFRRVLAGQRNLDGRRRVLRKKTNKMFTWCLFSRRYRTVLSS